jgi:hypothetical protein
MTGRVSHAQRTCMYVSIARAVPLAIFDASFLESVLLFEDVLLLGRVPREEAPLPLPLPMLRMLLLIDTARFSIDVLILWPLLYITRRRSEDAIT